MQLLDELFRSPDIEAVFSDSSFVQAMLDFEAALARAEARAGIVPSPAAEVISSNCRAALLDLSALTHSAAVSGNLAIPFVKQLNAIVAKVSPEAARFVHWGATSQDVLDTALILQLRRALELSLSSLDSMAAGLASLTESHRRTFLPARTWMQHALPTTFGFIAAGWLDALLRHQRRLAALQQSALVLQFGGAAGTLAALGARGAEVARFLAEELHLSMPDLPWHSHRDRLAEVATTYGLLAGSLVKIARDLSLHMQTELQEIHESSAPGRGSSSTMPHKRNPVVCTAILGAVLRVPGLVGTMLACMDHPEQRALGSWHAEWETLPEIIRLTAGALHHFAALIPDLIVDAKKMRENLEFTRGLTYSEAVSMVLSEKLGRQPAHERIAAACRRAQTENRHLREILAADPELSALLPPADLDLLFDPASYLGSADPFIDRVLATYRARHTQKFSAQG
ncbi:MAG TPA: 3-carboxy-cis,cis-muconate cycloisomerase [Terriglobales bacterium]|nr:3-carboxy-cis,cis-muconate cycloisomerase [Terriglobales bacterium]